VRWGYLYLFLLTDYHLFSVQFEMFCIVEVYLGRWFLVRTLLQKQNTVDHRKALRFQKKQNAIDGKVVYR